MFKTNVKLKHRVMVSNWRKSTYGTWRLPGDSQVYALQTVNIQPALDFIAKNPDVSLTHIIGKISGQIIQEFPQMNTLIRFGRFYQREDISIFFQVAMDDGGEDLSGYTVRNIDQKSVYDIKDEMRSQVKRIKQGDDFQYKDAKKTMGFVPTFFIPTLIRALGFILYSLNIWTKAIGTPRDSFGSMMITNIGGLGMQTAFAPLIPYSRVPLLLAVGKVYEKPVAENGEVKVQNSIDLCWTLDHRFIDGVLGAKMAKRFEEILADFNA